VTLPLELGVVGFLIAALATFSIGLAKSALPAAATMPVGVMALVLPPKVSIGAILPLLILGDLVALYAYRKTTDWSVLRRLAPWILVGFLIGYAFLDRASSREVGFAIGFILIFSSMWELNKKRINLEAIPWDDHAGPKKTFITSISGILIGALSMSANASGPIMAVYLIKVKLPILIFMGTTSWAFFIINISKVPFNVALGLITLETLQFGLIMSPLILFGGLWGQKLIKKLNQDKFEKFALYSTLIAGLLLFLPR
jgi:uncharacterized membrane protein YfcA